MKTRAWLLAILGAGCMSCPANETFDAVETQQEEVQEFKSGLVTVGQYACSVGVECEVNCDDSISNVNSVGARLYCSSLGKHVPNVDEWSLLSPPDGLPELTSSECGPGKVVVIAGEPGQCSEVSGPVSGIYFRCVP